MINTYLIDNKVWELTGCINNLPDMREAFVEMGNLASTLSAENQALKNAINNLLSPEAIDKIAKHVEWDLQENHYWRSTPKEFRDILKEYGYNKPVAYLQNIQEAFDIFDEGLPVFLLFRDGTERVARNGAEMEEHDKNGGIFGTTQFAYEKQEEIYLFGDDEDD